MERKQVVENLLKKGVLVSPRELEQLNREKREEKNSPEREISAEEMLRDFVKGYMALEKELMKRLEPVSINKISPLKSGVSIIGMVSEKTGRGFIIRDTTGEIEVSSNNDAEPGEVIGVKGFLKQGVFNPESIHYPDIPLARDAKNLGDIRLLFSEKREGNPMAIEPGGQFFPEEQNIRIRGNPVSVLKMTGELTPDQAVMMLKKRVYRVNDVWNYFIKEIPDFLWIHGGSQQWARNYKGVVIISTKEGSSALFDATTQAVSFRN